MNTPAMWRGRTTAAGCASLTTEEVRSHSKEAGAGDAASDILDVPVETAVLVDDESRRQFPPRRRAGAAT